jgi:formylmethanofuran:tetrahydromethanopterin formyltransferase
MQTTKEIEDQKTSEKSAAYRMMAEMWAFKDFMEMIRNIKLDAISSIPNMPSDQVTESKFGELRGIMSTIDKIDRDLDYILNFKEDNFHDKT